MRIDLVADVDTKDKLDNLALEVEHFVACSFSHFCPRSSENDKG